MRAFPATRDWHIHFVHRRDAEQPNSRRPARVLLRDGDAPELVAPVSGGTSRLFGFVYEAQDLAVEDHEWIACSPAVRWQPGRLPVVVRSHPLELELVDELEAERRRRREAASAVSRALSGGSTGSTLERVGLLEHADALLGGHVVPLAALEALRFELSSPPEIGDAADLNRRLRDAARIGNAALTRALSQVGFEEVGRNLDIRARLTTAVDRAFGAHSALDPRLWQTMRQRLLWSWWTHARVWSEGLDLNGLARKLGSDRRTLESLARAEIAPGPELRNHLPSEEDALQQLELPESLSSPQVAQIAASFRPRLELMSSQIAELERLVGRVDTLTTWESAAAALESIANDLEINRAQGLQVWELGRIAAEQFREGVDLGPRDPLPLPRLLGAAGLHVVAGATPLPLLLGEWAIGAGGAPIIALGPQVLSGDLGVARFAVAHQLGHLIESHATGRAIACSSIDAEEPPSGERESFANAFAVYLLAPRSAVRTLMGEPPSRVWSSPRAREWLWGATKDVAATFGLSAGAALPHVVNCLRELATREMLASLRQDRDWPEVREGARDRLENLWTDDRRRFDLEAGPGLAPAEALRRPRSTAFERLLDEAQLHDLIDEATANGLRAA
ncbi:MAG TPA: hypothetical protein DFS52_02580 [Myxococcales bacterium]|nr:hypothetical protein [Myxococcales bacterium]